MADVTISQLNSLTPGNGFVPVSIGGTTGKADLYIPHYPHTLTSNGRIQNYSINGTNVTINAGTQIAITGIRYTLPSITISVPSSNSLFWEPGVGYTVGSSLDEPGFNKAQLFYNDSQFGRIVSLCNKSTLHAWKNFFIGCDYAPIFTLDGYGYFGGVQNNASSNALYDGYFGRAESSPTYEKTSTLNLIPSLGTDYQFFNDPTNKSYQYQYTRVWLYWGRAPRIVNHSGNNGYWYKDNMNNVSARLFQQNYFNDSFRYIQSEDVFELYNPIGCPDIHSVLMASG